MSRRAGFIMKNESGPFFIFKSHIDLLQYTLLDSIIWLLMLRVEVSALPWTCSSAMIVVGRIADVYFTEARMSGCGSSRDEELFGCEKTRGRIASVSDRPTTDLRFTRKRAF